MAKMSLKAARVNAEMTQDEAANKLGVSTRTVQKWEKGETFPDANKRDDICKAYGVTYDDLKFLS